MSSVVTKWPKPEAYNPEHAPICGMCIGAVFNMPSTTVAAKEAISLAAVSARETIDPFTVRAWGKPIVVNFGVYPPSEVIDVVRELEGRLAEVRELVPLAHLLVSVTWPEFEYPQDIPFQERTTDELIRAAAR